MLAIALLIFTIVAALFAGLPAITIDAGAVVASSAYAYIRAACYFIPVNTVLTIMSIVFMLWIVRVTIAFAKMLWDVLPVA